MESGNAHLYEQSCRISFCVNSNTWVNERQRFDFVSTTEREREKNWTTLYSCTFTAMLLLLFR